MLGWVYAPETPEELKRHPAVESLRQVWVQQYYLQCVPFCLRRLRYLGQAKTHLQHILIDVARFVAWINEMPLAATRTSAFATLANAEI